jgi:hypothetical protein
MSDSWEFSTKNLAKHFKMSPTTVCKYTKELKECGYIKVEYARTGKNGRFIKKVWNIFEKPDVCITKNCVSDVCITDVCITENDNIKNINNKNINNKNIKGKEEGDFVPPSLEEVSAYCQERQNGIDPEQFISFYASKGWKVGKHKMVDWKACVRTWEKRQKPKAIPKKSGVDFDELMRWAEEEDRKAGGDI